MAIGPRPEAGRGYKALMQIRTHTLQRPLLLLDVDGVICPMGSFKGKKLLCIEGPHYPMFYAATTPGHLQELGKVFTLVWATSLEEDANRLLSPALSLPSLPFIRFDTPGKRPGRSYKLSAVKKFAGDRPLAWLDDEVGDDMRAWAKKRRSPTLVLEIDPRVGLGLKDVAELLQFASRIAEQPIGPAVLLSQ